MLALSTSLATGEGHMGALAVYSAVETQVEAWYLCDVYEVGAGYEARDDAGTDLGEGPRLALREGHQQIHLRVVEIFLVIWFRDAKVVFTKGCGDGDFVRELDAVALAAGLEDDTLWSGSELLDGPDCDGEDGCVDLLGCFRSHPRPYTQ